jgi:putative SOS response-associated peptidase YedK
MCGRYTNLLTWEEIVEICRITEPSAAAAPNLRPRYNAAPTDTMPVGRALPDGGRELAMLRWGLLPFWTCEAKGPAQDFRADLTGAQEVPR